MSIIIDSLLYVNTLEYVNPLTKDLMSRQDLKKNVLKLLKEDEEFRYAVAGLIGMDEILKRLDRHEGELVKLREDMVKGFELVERHISALGARWGLMSEEAFREEIRGLLEKEMNLKVERWTSYDKEGVVYGYPSQVEVDVALHDEKVILIGVTSHARASDVYALRRKSDLYEKKTGRKISRSLIVTPYSDDETIKASKELGIKIYTKV